MARTKEEQELWEKQCYGADGDSVRENNKSTIRFYFGCAGMATMSMLSDAQALMEMGELEEARQLLNRVKTLLSDHVVLPHPSDKDQTCPVCRTKKELGIRRIKDAKRNNNN